MTSQEHFGAQFNCPTCGNPQYTAEGFTPHDHAMVSLDASDRDQMRAISENAKLHAQTAEVERTRKVDLSNKADLLDHLASNNGHIMRMPEWRASYLGEGPNKELGAVVPGVRDYKGEDFKLTLPELQIMHDHLHRIWEEPHLTNGNEHYHV